jgi:hypothetical protein
MTDGFGRRVASTDAASGEPVECLELSPGLAAHTGFATALTDRVARLADVRHANYVRVRRLDRLGPNQLVVVSDQTPGPRLSDLLEYSQRTSTRPDIEVVVALMRQLLPAVGLFARHNKSQAIGVIAPERLFVLPAGRMVVADIMLGSALDQLTLEPNDAWRRYGVVSPSKIGPVVCTPRGDGLALGIVALSMLLGRMLADPEFPGGLSHLVASLRERHGGEDRPLSPGFAKWLVRALQIDEPNAFDSPHAAQIGFEEVLAEDPRYVTRGEALSEWLNEYERWSKDKSKPRASKQGAGRKPAAWRVDSKSQESPQEGKRVGPVQEQEADDEPADEQVSESPVAVRPAPRTGLAAVLPKVAAGLLGLVLVEAAVIAWLSTRSGPVIGAGDGELSVHSRPASARVVINGEERGETPLLIKLPSGTHVMELRLGAAEPRVIPLTIRPGVQTAQYVELQDPRVPVPARQVNGKRR